MPIIETLGLILTSSTAKSVAKFLYEKIDEYIHNKLGNKPSDEVAKLKNEVEELKTKMEAKDQEQITPAEVEALKQKVIQIEKSQSPLPANIVSGEIFQKWSEMSELDDEDQALLVRKQLEVLLDKANELAIKDRKRFEIQDVCASLDINLRKLKDARNNVRRRGLRADQDEEERREYLLKNTISLARDVLKAY